MLSPLVVDLSHWNTVTSMQAMKQAGAVGIIHKATESTDFYDPELGARRWQASVAGLEWGAYHFLRPGSMQAQADWFLRNARPDDTTLLAADHEDPAVPLADLKVFLRAVEQGAGLVPVLYSGFLIKDQLGDQHDAELARYPLWLAHYTMEAPTWPTATWPNWWLWQYTEDGTIDGVDDVVDLNQYDGTAQQLIHDWHRKISA